MAKDYLSYEDVYEIAAEVAQETITKFLQNLVKLVPNSQDIVDDIQEQQYRDLRNMRSQAKPNYTQPTHQQPSYSQAPLQESVNQSIPEAEADDFDAIAHPNSGGVTDKSIFDVLGQIPGDDAGMAQVIRDDR